ncbi:MAG: hypothetical protein ACR2FF_03220 [Mycobacteriales bacterium]
MVNQLASDARRRAVREVPSSHLPDTAAAASDDADQIRNESEIEALALTLQDRLVLSACR